MRAIVTASRFEKVHDCLDVDSVSLDSFCETEYILDPELLREVFQYHSTSVSFKFKGEDTRIEVFVERMFAVLSFRMRIPPDFLGQLRGSRLAR